MAVNQRQLISVLTAEIEQLDERCPGYRKAVLDHLAEIVVLERGHRTHRTIIQKQVTEQCQALGDFLASRLKKLTAEEAASEGGEDTT